MTKIEKLAQIVSASLELKSASAMLIMADDLDANDSVLIELFAKRQEAQNKLSSLIDYGFNDYGDMQAIFDAAAH